MFGRICAGKKMAAQDFGPSIEMSISLLSLEHLQKTSPNGSKTAVMPPKIEKIFWILCIRIFIFWLLFHHFCSAAQHYLHQCVGLLIKTLQRSIIDLYLSPRPTSSTMSFATSAPKVAQAVTATFATYCTADFLSNFIQVSV